MCDFVVFANLSNFSCDFVVTDCHADDAGALASAVRRLNYSGKGFGEGGVVGAVSGARAMAGPYIAFPIHRVGKKHSSQVPSSFIFRVHPCVNTVSCTISLYQHFLFICVSMVLILHIAASHRMRARICPTALFCQFHSHQYWVPAFDSAHRQCSCSFLPASEADSFFVPHATRTFSIWKGRERVAQFNRHRQESLWGEADILQCLNNAPGTVRKTAKIAGVHLFDGRNHN